MARARAYVAKHTCAVSAVHYTLMNRPGGTAGSVHTACVARRARVSE
jgi:hypothetical protein